MDKFMLHNDKVKKVCFDILGKDNIILIQYGGSVAYHLTNKNSDYDVLAITKEWKPLENVSNYSDNSFQLLCLKNLDFINKMDLFVIDYKNAIKIHNMDKDTSRYVRMFVDSTIYLDKTLIYKNDKYNKEYNNYSSIDLESKIIPYYNNIINYYNTLYYVTSPNKYRKHEYHIFRFLDNFDYFLKTGKYKPDAYGKNYKKMMDFKGSSQNNFDSQSKQFVAALNELEIKFSDFKNNNCMVDKEGD